MIEVEDEVLKESLAGSSLREIASRRSISHETVRDRLARATRLLADQAELDLMVASKYEALGRPAEAHFPVLLIPNGPERTTALNLLQLVLDRLEERGVKTKLVHTAVPDGSAFQIVTAEEN